MVHATMDAAPEPSATSNSHKATSDEVLSQIREALQNLQFGTVSIVVQDGIVVQIDRTEKRRIRRPPTR